MQHYVMTVVFILCKYANIIESFAKTSETKCNNQGVIMCNTPKTQRKMWIIKGNTLKCISRVFANHSTAHYMSHITTEIQLFFRQI